MDTIILLPCPFCGSDKIKYSTKVSKGYYQASCYCSNCHTYGPRVLSDKFPSPYPDYSKYYEARYKAHISGDLELKAKNAWNARLK